MIEKYPRIILVSKAKFTLVVLVVSTNFMLTLGVDAGFLPSLDLAGLLLHSKAVVLAERVGFGDELTRFRVKITYKGSLFPGDDFTVDLRGYALMGDGQGWKLETIDPENILFLQQTEPAKLVKSGIKVLSGGKVYGFEQRRNPGPYSLYPQIQHPKLIERNSQDTSGDRAEAMTLATFESYLQKEITRVDEFIRINNIEDAVLREKCLLELLGPTRLEPVHLKDYERYELDDLEVRVLKTLYENYDFATTLKGLARTRPNRLPFLPEKILDTTDPSKLVQAAMNRDLSIDLREAAALALRSCWWNTTETALYAVMRSLLQDPNPEIRRASLVNLVSVLHNINTRKEHPEALETILSAGCIESEPLTRLLFLEVAGWLQFRELMIALSEGNPVTILAGFHAQKVYVTWAFPKSDNMIEAFLKAVAVRREDGTERRIDSIKVQRTYDVWGTMSFGFEPQLQEGNYDLFVEGSFRSKESEFTAASRVVSVTVPIERKIYIK